VWVDATYVKARQDGRVVSVAMVIAVGVRAQTGEREILGLDVAPGEGGPADGGSYNPHRLRPARCQERLRAVA
jgi:hypothetical protein